MAKTIKQLNIGILGPGGIGGLLAALLCKSGYQVYCFGSKQGNEAIKHKGLMVNSVVYGDFKIKPLYELSKLDHVDILFLCVKSPILKGALESVISYVNRNTVVVSLLNGLGHREKIKHLIDSNLVVGTIGAVEVSMKPDRTIDHRSSMTPHITIASNSGVSRDRLLEVVSVLKNSRLSAELCQHENNVTWKKLTRLAAIASITSYTGSPLGPSRIEKKSRELLLSLVEELCQIAHAEGVDLGVNEVVQQIDKLPETLTTSLQRDISANIPSEIDSIILSPINLGKKLGLPTDALEFCYSHIKKQIEGRK